MQLDRLKVFKDTTKEKYHLCSVLKNLQSSTFNSTKNSPFSPAPYPSPDGSVTTLWCGRINAKDFYGEYVGFRRFYVLGNNDENTVTIENPKDKYSTCIINDVCEGSSINKY